VRVAYYHEWSGGPESGVFKKIVSQVNHWARLGADAAVFNLSATDTEPQWYEALDPDVSFEQVMWRSRMERFRCMPALVARMMGWEPDLVYRRNGPWYPPFDRVGATVPLVLEVNANDLTQARAGSLHRHAYVKLTRRRLLGRAAALVFVGHELSTHRNFAGPRVPRRVIANGIDLELFSPMPAPANDSPRLAFLGSASQRNAGVDKILFLARQFPEWGFDLIGPSTRDFRRALPSNVSAHGVMTADAYAPTLAAADVAIGPLACHRVGVREISALKTLEYVAWGIPAVIGHKDTNFMEAVDFILELPSSEHNVSANLGRIEEFVVGCRGRRVPREAILHIGCEHKERERLGLFEEVLALWRG